MRSWTSGLLSLALFLVPTCALAATSPWDLIYADRLDLSLCGNVCGIYTNGLDVALLVNTGSSTISGDVLAGATFTVRSSRPEIGMRLYVSDPGPPMTPILPGEAIGSVVEGDLFTGPNDILLGQLRPSETHHNTSGRKVLSIGVARTGFNDFEGPVHFDVEMTLGGSTAKFAIDADVRLGDFRLEFARAARVAAASEISPVARASWGQVRARYR
jgi:hypothetical protein